MIQNTSWIFQQDIVMITIKDNCTTWRTFITWPRPNVMLIIPNYALLKPVDDTQKPTSTHIMLYWKESEVSWSKLQSGRSEWSHWTVISIWLWQLIHGQAQFRDAITVRSTAREVLRPYLLWIPSVIRFRFNGRRSLLQSALRRFILHPLDSYNFKHSRETTWAS